MEICLFHERWIKTFYTQSFGQLCIRYGIVFYKISLVQFCKKYMVGPSQKNSFRALGKWKMNFPCKENENFLRQHCFTFQYAPLCTIWDHLNKLCHECGHKIDYLAWKPWIFMHDSSFLEHFFKVIVVLQVYYFPENLVTYDDTMWRFSIFFDFFWIFYACFKMRSKRRAWPFLASGWILENFWCFSD